MTATSTNPAIAANATETLETSTAQTSVSAGTSAPAPLAFNTTLAEVHAPTTCLPSTMSRLAPFPAIAALPDAVVLDVHLSLSPRADGLVALHTKARYESAASATEAAAFYQVQLTAASDDVTTVIGAPDGADSHFDAALGSGRYGARVFDLGRTTTVMIETESAQLLEHVPLVDLANWHGLSELKDAIVDRTEVFTVAAGASAQVQAIYSTEYRLPGVTPGQARSLADALLQDQGWSATETFEDSLRFHGTFGGEAHITGTNGDTRLTLVGEFPLANDESTLD